MTLPFYRAKSQSSSGRSSLLQTPLSLPFLFLSLFLLMTLVFLALQVREVVQRGQKQQRLTGYSSEVSAVVSCLNPI